MNNEHLKSKRGLFFLAISLYFTGLITSIILLPAEPLIQIERPWILLTVSCACAFPLRSQSFHLLQRLLLIYFICMLIGQLTMEQIILTSQSSRFMLPQSLIPLVLYAAGFVLYVISGQPGDSLKQNAYWYRVWLLTCAILILHMICLWFPLKSIYGFGCVHNIEVLGNLLLYTACFFFTWDILNQPVVRYLSSGCVIILLLLIVI